MTRVGHVFSELLQRAVSRYPPSTTGGVPTTPRRVRSGCSAPIQHAAARPLQGRSHPVPSTTLRGRSAQQKSNSNIAPLETPFCRPSEKTTGRLPTSTSNSRSDVAASSDSSQAMLSSSATAAHGHSSEHARVQCVERCDAKRHPAITPCFTFPITPSPLEFLRTLTSNS